MLVVSRRTLRFPPPPFSKERIYYLINLIPSSPLLKNGEKIEYILDLIHSQTRLGNKIMSKSDTLPYLAIAIAVGDNNLHLIKEISECGNGDTEWTDITLSVRLSIN